MYCSISLTSDDKLPILTRGSEEGHSALKLFSADEVMGLLPIFSPCKNNS